ncbi:CidA/LrgA family protein [Acaryochloris sp. CCMEE 5410]|uniref:CidA/LrgA family protein n=1 Tax=Acaryochloris sp. CCMEE 5410 TaxID=310037 RepID=UPI0002483E8E|nr:CidA/LrgA family protein [Acaryochloris sp. CCMEE 5410]KAI9133428.1 CidA/LrgA family protein [Acaryochloris sp. CCMEE 5410]
MITGFLVLLLYELLGEVLVLLLNLPTPGPVIGMFLLLLTLMMLGKIPEDVENAATTLLSHLSLLFVPAGVGVMVHFQRIRSEGWAILVALLVSTVVTLMVSAWTMQVASKVLTLRRRSDA